MYNPNYYSNPYMNYGNYFNQQAQQPIQNPVIQNFRATGLQGKQIDSLDVVKATDIPLDGSISYFPLADNSSIATKQLMPDGTSKITIFKPVDGDVAVEQPKYITENDLTAYLSDFSNKDIKDIKEELKSLKKKIRGLEDEIENKGEE